MKLLIFDDHRVITDAIASYAKANSDVEIIAQCHRIVEVKKAFDKTIPDIVISDILTDEDEGFALFEYILRRNKKVKIVAYSCVSNDFIIQSLLQMGVSAFINKRETLATLWQKVEDVYQNKDNENVRNLQKIKNLTAKEKKIVMMLTQGFAAKEIASELNSSVNTINNQKNSLLLKFNCNNSTELIIKLSQMGLINVL